MLRLALVVAGAAAATRPRLAWWVQGPVSSGCSGWGLPYPGFNATSKAQTPSCFNNTLGLVAARSPLIDEVVLAAGGTEEQRGLVR